MNIPTIPACTLNKCGQRAENCPCPSACFLSEDDCFERDVSKAIVYGAIAACVAAVVAAVIL